MLRNFHVARREVATLRQEMDTAVGRLASAEADLAAERDVSRVAARDLARAKERIVSDLQYIPNRYSSRNVQSLLQKDLENVITKREEEMQRLIEHSDVAEDKPGAGKMIPCLFLVLPGPCLENSRYLTAERLEAILNSLGYALLHTRTTRKLNYSLWRHDGVRAAEAWVKGNGQTIFKKNEIRSGGGRNNFCIVLE